MNYYTREEILKHNMSDDCWIYVDNNVYNITEFIYYNPEHAVPILNNYNINNKTNYMFHSKNGKSIWKKYQIGYIQKSWPPFVVEIKNFMTSFLNK